MCSSSRGKAPQTQILQLIQWLIFVTKSFEPWGRATLGPKGEYEQIVAIRKVIEKGIKFTEIK